jgi:hypothetical protein
LACFCAAPAVGKITLFPFKRKNLKVFILEFIDSKIKKSAAKAADFFIYC